MGIRLGSIGRVSEWMKKVFVRTDKRQHKEEEEEEVINAFIAHSVQHSEREWVSEWLVWLFPAAVISTPIRYLA